VPRISVNRMRKIFNGVALGMAAVASLASCSRAPAEPTATSTSTPTVASTSTGAAATSLPQTANPNFALRWDDPTRWVRRAASSPMRVAEYLVPHAAGDAADAECTVITFGSNQGGGVDDNVDRWVRQFNPLSGAPTKAKRRIGEMTVTRVEVAGSYHPMMMPGGSGAPIQPDARLVGAIVEAPSGLWFFKLTGPDATVKAAAAELDAMIGSLRAG
jgi:hypothetical protein